MASPLTPAAYLAHRGRLPVMGVVAILHVLAMVTMLNLRGWPERDGPAGPVPALMVSLLAELRAPDRTPQTPSREAAALRRWSPPAPRRIPEVQDFPPEPSPGSGRSLDSDRPAAAPVTRTPLEPAITTPPPPTAPAASAPLNLALPVSPSAPWRQRHPARDDPRSNSVPRTLESRLAAAMAGSEGRTTQEVLADGSLRLRRGADCVVAHPNRAESLEPFNASVLPKPRMVQRC